MEKLQKLKGHKIKVCEEHILDHQKYEKEYGKNTAVFTQVGDFYEMYSAILEDGTELYYQKMQDICQKCSLVYNIKNGVKFLENNDNILYMSGFPTHALDKFLNLLVDTYEWTVVVIDQVKNIVAGKTEVTRKVKGVYSPGTNFTTNADSNVLVCVYLEMQKSRFNKHNKILYAGLSYLDCITGESGVKEIWNNYDSINMLIDEIRKYICVNNPKEIVIYHDGLADIFNNSDILMNLSVKDRCHKIFDKVESVYYKLDYQEQVFNKIFNVKTKLNIIQYLDLDTKMFARISYLLLLNYVWNRLPNIIQQLEKPIVLENELYLTLANDSLEQLKVVFESGFFSKQQLSLLKLLDNSTTAIGRRTFRFRLLNPIRNIDILEKRYMQIELMLNRNNKGVPTRNMIDKVNNKLIKILDIERLSRLMGTINITPMQLVTLINSCVTIKELIEIIEELPPRYNILQSLLPSKGQLEDFNNFIKKSQKNLNIKECNKCNNINDIERNIFNVGLYPEIDVIQEDYDSDNNILVEIRDTLISLIKAHSSFVTKAIKGNAPKVQNIIKQDYNEKYKHYLYCSPSNGKTMKKALDELPSNFCIKIGKYKIKPKDIVLDKINNMRTLIKIDCITTSSHSMVSIGYTIQNMVKEKFAEHVFELYKEYHTMFKSISNFIGEIDVLKTCASNAIKYNYYQPNINMDCVDSYIDTQKIRHPLIERINKKVQYIPHDIILGKDGTNGILLFGANASGKSACMKSIGLNLIMAQAGMYVAAEQFNYHPYNYLFTRIQGNDDIQRSKSSFEVEMSELKTILSNVDNHSIILGDELCRGTENISGTAIVAAGIQKLASKNSSFIFATHLHGLSDIEEVTTLNNVKFKHLTVMYDNKSDKLIYDRKIKDGVGATIYGLEVCKALSLDEEFLEMANIIRKKIIKQHDHITSIKSSNYNANVFQDKCMICGGEREHIHHIKFQSDADENKMISEINAHKNIEHNQVALCESCHHKVHSNEIEINGYIITSFGRELDYKIKNK
jgi:DNA mismatch repair protein MutS